MVEQKVFDVFVNELKLDVNVDKDTLKYNETTGWDSLAHMRIVASLEEVFDCIMETDDILDMSSFRKALEIMGKY